MALRNAWQKMKDTLSAETRQFLVTRELWEIFLAKDRKVCPVIENLRLRRKKRLEKMFLRNVQECSSKIEALNEKGNLRILING